HRRPPQWLDHAPALHAIRAYARPDRRSAPLNARRLQIHFPAPLGDIVGVADAVAKLRPFAAKITDACHSCPFEPKLKLYRKPCVPVRGTLRLDTPSSTPMPNSEDRPSTRMAVGISHESCTYSSAARKA